MHVKRLYIASLAIHQHDYAHLTPLARSPRVSTGIRCENREDAGADANRIFIEHVLDPNVDMTALRLTGFGFRDMDFVIPENQAVYQVRRDQSFCCASLLQESKQVVS